MLKKQFLVTIIDGDDFLSKKTVDELADFIREVIFDGLLLTCDCGDNVRVTEINNIDN